MTALVRYETARTVLSRRLARETTVDEANVLAIKQALEQSAWRDTVEEGGR